VETPLPLLNNETDEGHTTMEINNLLNNSKPEPRNMFINFKNDDHELTNSEIKKLSQLG